MKIKQHLRIVTRKSPLAMWQATYVKKQIESTFPGCHVDIMGVTTQGDRFLDVSLAKIGGKGLFIKELEHSLLSGTADLAVHSMKDMTVEIPNGLELTAVLQRGNPYDALVSSRQYSLQTLPLHAKIGTSSLRRQAQLKNQRPDLQIEMLRGNVNTRLGKLEEGKYDAIILACAGLERLGLSKQIGHILPPEECLPAVGQGALGLECATDNETVCAMLKKLDDLSSHQCVIAERAMNQRLDGGCATPVAGFAEIINGLLCLRGLVASLDGKQILQATQTGQPTAAEKIGHLVAQDLLNQGAASILQKAMHEKK